MATFTVNTLVDENDGVSVGSVSLRDAITEANSTPGADTIEFSIAGGTITLTNGELRITDDLTINGLGADQLTIDGDGQSRVFNVDDGNETPDKTVDIDGLTITGGQVSGSTVGQVSGFGGGIFNQENLSVTNSSITGNSANGFFSNGGGISNDVGTLNVTSSTISGNTSRSNAGGIINRMGTLNVTNSTISGNSARYGGGIVNFATTNVTNSTISGNSASGPLGGGIVNFVTTNVNVSNSIIADNVSTTNVSVSDISGSFTSGGNNLIGNGSGGSGFTDGSNGDIVGTTAVPVDPVLGPLQDNGGPTFTQALLAGSPAINTGDANGETTDQRGEDRVQQGFADIGAFESAFSRLPAGDIPDESIFAYDPFILDVNDIITDPDGDSLTFTTNSLPSWLSFDAATGTFSGLPTSTDEGTVSIEVTADDGTETFTDSFDLTVELPLNDTNNNIRGSGGNDSLPGTNANNDNIRGRGGNDTLNGANGDDNLFGNGGRDTLNGGNGNDYMDGGGGNDSLNGGNQDDILVGGRGDDILVGGENRDTLDGGNGVDELRGGDGPDVLIGGKGLDILFGGNNNDLFVLGAGQGRDTIKDFGNGADRFLLTGGLTFDDLNIRESAAGDTIIRASGNGVLAIVENVSSSLIGAEDFTTIVDEFSVEDVVSETPNDDDFFNGGII